MWYRNTMNRIEKLHYFKRQFGGLLVEALKNHSVVYLSGSRNAGKTMLAREICQGDYVSFNSPLLLAAALTVPGSFFKSLSENELTIVDEAHFDAGLFKCIEDSLGNNNDRSGQTPERRFLLIGSMSLPMLFGNRAFPESHVTELTLLPFYAAERRGVGTNFLRRLLIGKMTPRTFDTIQLADEIENATFPELALNHEINREQWFDGFLSTVLQRDIQTAAGIRNSERIVPLLISLATRVGSLINDASIIKETGLDAKTYAKYKAAAMHTFLTFEMEPWGGADQMKKRYVKQSKIYFTDTNLLCYVMRRNLREVLVNDPPTAARLFENFVATEIIKQAVFIGGTRIRHFSLSGGKAVNFLIEAENGRAVGIDVSFKSTISDRDFGNLRVMRTALGKNFNRGILIYAGTELSAFSDDFWAVPVNALWE